MTANSIPSHTTILFLTANPQETPKLQVEQEIRGIEQGLERSRYRDYFDLQVRRAIRLRDLSHALLAIQPRSASAKVIIHFSGHGEGERGLVFEDEEGRPRFVDSRGLTQLLRMISERENAVQCNVECVILNACYTEVQAQAISEHIPYVIGLKQEINDRKAIEFAVTFYDALAAGYSIPFAHDWACAVLRTHREVTDDLVPVLIADRRVRRFSSENLSPSFPNLSSPPPRVSLIPNSTSSVFNGFNRKIYKWLRKPRLVLLALLLLAILGYIILHLLTLFPPQDPFPVSGEQSSPESTTSPQFQKLTSIDQLGEQSNIKDRTSFGEKYLLKEETSGCPSVNGNQQVQQEIASERNTANEFMRKKQYTEAIRHFGNILNTCANAPETRIYWNNAKVEEQKSESAIVAVVIPNTLGTYELEDDSLRMLRGFAQAQHYVNQQGGLTTKSGRKLMLKILIISAGEEPKVREDIATELKPHGDVVAILGDWTSAVSLEAAKQYKKAEMIFVTPISILNDDYYKVKELKGYFFRVNNTIASGAETLVDYANTLPSDKFWVFHSAGEYAPFLKDAFLSGVGADRVTLQEITESIDLEVIAQQITESEALPVLVFFPSNQDALKVSNYVEAIRRKAGTKKIPGLIGDLANLATPNILRQARGSLNDMVVAPPWFYERDTPFTRDSDALWKEAEVDWTSAMSYDAAQAIITAIRETSSASREEVRVVLTSTENNGLPNLKISGASRDFEFNSYGSTTELKSVLTRVCSKKFTKYEESCND
jgi:ABC-type branched-subunit amino acid transport system substrate-binding protein